MTAAPINVVAWTGGSAPAPLLRISGTERRLVRVLFREQVAAWKDYWRRPLPADVRRILWGRARYDAHASVREHLRHPAPLQARAERLRSLGVPYEWRVVRGRSQLWARPPARAGFGTGWINVSDWALLALQTQFG